MQPLVVGHALLCVCHDAAGCHVIVCFATVDENKVLAGKAGAIDAVVAAMRAHVGNAGLSEQACETISIFCVNIGAFGVGCVLSADDGW